jgi:tetratricopeptide (TPR) repeat protein
MNKSIVELPRRVIPRWRSFFQTVAQKELDQTGIRKSSKVDAQEVEKLERNWKTSRSEHSAGELVSAVLFAEPTSSSKEAAEYLLKSASASPISKDIALIVLGEAPPDSALRNTRNLPSPAAWLKSLRKILKINPLDSYRWVEMALAYTKVGELQKADRALKVALGTSRDDRYVFRSLTRFKQHQSRPEEAVRILARSQRVRFDPWLLAAYVAAATVANIPVRFQKEAKGLISSANFSEFDRAELRAALATIELEHGNEKRARKLFQQALSMPTENVVAQALWVSFRSTSIVVEPLKSLPPRNFEGDALQALFSSNWSLAFERSKDWLSDEGCLDHCLSSRVATHDTLLSSAGLEPSCTGPR